MKNILNTLAFFVSLGKGNTHSFREDGRTKNAVKSLEKRGFLSVNWDFKQASWTGQLWAK